MIIQVISAIIAVYFSAIVFEAPKKLLPYIAFIGGGGWLIYLLILQYFDISIATYLSGLAIAFSSHIAARQFKAPVTVFFIPGFFPLVPGAGMYKTVYWYITGDSLQSQANLNQTMVIAGMIALAIFTVDSLFRLVSILKHLKK
ncbi:Uncharacterized membrane protein YjjB, DUF3815 family [Granulicatella balaenopterae]|uniref:Uncharacterized membrane protein YjjB, DUF3815 family n=1 Tax=Granulicatella balaenopterae TaxID=137733 RepID=A0A1H9MNG4_9LACT|nr:threonine/serine exporter family protein [Granulicatella balaenopterae]SER24975.1 Uncharacterized membrane protein YjjB, DUF3815 family [Granulicatella balaenopterae]